MSTDWATVGGRINVFIDKMILMACQPVLEFLIPRNKEIVFIVCSYLLFCVAVSCFFLFCRLSDGKWIIFEQTYLTHTCDATWSTELESHHQIYFSWHSFMWGTPFPSRGCGQHILSLNDRSSRIFGELSGIQARSVNYRLVNIFIIPNIHLFLKGNQLVPHNLLSVLNCFKMASCELSFDFSANRK